jgi:hypothetical protein
MSSAISDRDKLGRAKTEQYSQLAQNGREGMVSGIGD